MVVAVLALYLAATDGGTMVRGEITYPDGGRAYPVQVELAPFASSPLNMVPELPHDVVQSTPSSTTGTFELTSVRPGVWALWVRAPWREPVVVPLWIDPGTRDLSVKIRLPSREHFNHEGQPLVAGAWDSFRTPQAMVRASDGGWVFEREIGAADAGYLLVDFDQRGEKRFFANPSESAVVFDRSDFRSVATITDGGVRIVYQPPPPEPERERRTPRGHSRRSRRTDRRGSNSSPASRQPTRSSTTSPPGTRIRSSAPTR